MSSSLTRRIRTALGFCAALPLCLAGFCTAGCAKQPEADAAPMTAKEVARAADPSDWKLSPEAEHLYYYLLLSQALSDNDQIVIAHALKGLLKLDPSLPVYQDSATILLARGEFGAAQATSHEGLTHFPDDTLLTLLLAGAYSESGQIPKAVRLLEEHLKIRPGASDAIEELVRLYLKEGNEKKASDLVMRLPRTDDSPEAELFRAGVLSTVGRHTEARQLLRVLLDRCPGLHEGWLELAYLAERENDPAEAVKAYEKAGALMPENAEIWYRIALLHIEAKKPADALVALDKAAPTPALTTQAALRFADGGYHKEAEALLARAEKAGADPERTAIYLSIIRQESSDPLAGLAPLTRIPSGSALYPAALEQKARVYLRVDQYAKARAAACEGRKRFPEVKALWGIEAYALTRMEKNEEAESLLRQALARYAGDEELLFSLGTLQNENGKQDAAMKTMEHIITINPKNYQALNYVGYTLADNNTELKRALTLITTALEQRPDAGYIVDSLAWAQYRLGNFDEAWKSINRCISLGGDDAAIWEHYGDIALALDKREEAAKGYTESIARKPDNIEAVRKKLSGLKR